MYFFKMGRFASIHDDMKKIWSDKNGAINEKSAATFALTTIYRFAYNHFLRKQASDAN